MLNVPLMLSSVSVFLNRCWCYHGYCRNNLTVLDVVAVQGSGGRGELRFSNRKMSGATPPLGFELNEKHLKNCDSEFIVIVVVAVAR